MASTQMLAKMSAAMGGIPMRLIDDIDDPRDDGAFVTIVVYTAGEAEGLVFELETFYDCLGRLIAAMLPGCADGVTH